MKYYTKEIAEDIAEQLNSHNIQVVIGGHSPLVTFEAEDMYQRDEMCIEKNEESWRVVMMEVEL